LGTPLEEGWLATLKAVLPTPEARNALRNGATNPDRGLSVIRK
jgi:hypothetical protein